MEILTARGLSSVMPLLAFGCSLALDTASLQGATAADASLHEEAAPTTTDAPTEDVAAEAPGCTEPGQEPCNRCLATYCCPQSSDCTHDATCNVALVALQQCRRDARTSDNPRLATTACNASFGRNGGIPAAALLTCTMMSCQAICAG